MRRSWTSTPQVGIEELDAQHRRLFAEAVRFVEDVDGKGPLAADERLEALEAVAREHFGFEERLMREHAFPAADAAVHQREHRDLVRTLRRIVVETPRDEVARAIEAFLRRWLLHHIGVTDVKLGYFLRRRGVR